MKKRQQLHAAITAADGNSAATDASFQWLHERMGTQLRRPGEICQTSAAKTASSQVGSKPSRVNSATPRSNSSRANGLAGATTGNPIT